MKPPLPHRDRKLLTGKLQQGGVLVPAIQQKSVSAVGKGARTNGKRCQYQHEKITTAVRMVSAAGPIVGQTLVFPGACRTEYPSQHQHSSNSTQSYSTPQKVGYISHPLHRKVLRHRNGFLFQTARLNLHQRSASIEVTRPVQSHPRLLVVFVLKTFPISLPVLPSVRTDPTLERFDFPWSQVTGKLALKKWHTQNKLDPQGRQSDKKVIDQAVRDRVSRGRKTSQYFELWQESGSQPQESLSWACKI